MATNTKSKTNTKGVLFLVAGFLLLLRYLLTYSVPAFQLKNIPQIILNIFVLFLVIFFYGFFLIKFNDNEKVKTLAPSILLLIIGGQYSTSIFTNAEVNAYMSMIGSIIWLLLIVTGFISCFIYNKIIQTTFGACCIVGAFFVLASYISGLITSLTNGGKFNTMELFTTLLLIGAYVLLFIPSVKKEYR